MKTVPTLLVVTDRGHLIAYRNESGQTPERIDDVQFLEGNQRLSEMVTDQAGAFPGTGGVSTSAGENHSLAAEMETRCIRQIAMRIEQLLENENRPLWGLAAPAEIHSSILEHLKLSTRDRLAMQIKKDLVKLSPGGIMERFTEARRQEMAMIS